MISVYICMILSQYLYIILLLFTRILRYDLYDLFVWFSVYICNILSLYLYDSQLMFYSSQLIFV